MVYNRGGSIKMKLAIIETSMGKYFYYHFLPLLKEKIEEAKLITLDKVDEFKHKGFFIVSDIEEIAGISLKKFIKIETIYSFSEVDLKAFKEFLDETKSK